DGSVVDLTPAGQVSSRGTATDGTQQVGGNQMWTGTAASVVTFPAFSSDYRVPALYGVGGGRQVGVEDIPFTGKYQDPFEFSGTPNSGVNLGKNQNGAYANATDGVQVAGYIWNSGLPYRATVWNGPNNFVDLHPLSGYFDSFANGVGG